MNRLFNLKASIIVFAVLFCQTVLKAQNVSQVDTSHVLATNIDTTKKAHSSMVVKSDTALIVKAGATIVQRADTTLVINADPELIRSFNQIVAAKQQADQHKADSVAASKQSTFTQVRSNVPPAQKSDSTASAPSPGSVPVPAVNTGAAAASVGAVTTAVSNVAKTDASIPAQTNNTNTTPPADNNSQPSNTANNTVTSTTPVTKPDSTAAANNTTTQQATTNSNTTAQTTKADSNATANAAAVQPKKADSTQQATTGNTTSVKPDSSMIAKVDTTIKKDTTKKSDTTAMKKDTSLMVADTSQHEVRAQNVFLEVGGAGLAISANYDARFHQERDGWGYTVGLGFFTSGGNTVETVPFQVNYLIGEHSSMLELGAGTTFLNSVGTNVGTSKWEFDKVTGFIATGAIGYRYQPAKKGINFRIAFTPILYDEGIIPAGGISIGYTFK